MLNQLPNHTIWKPSHGDGIRSQIVEDMNEIRLVLTDEIDDAFGDMPAARLLATTCLNATETFLTQLLLFVDTIYEKLHGFSKFTTEQGWALAMQILDRICGELFSPKKGVSSAIVIEDPTNVCGHVLWSSCKTHDVMSTDMKHKFENHPAISAEYIKFLATNSGSEKVEKLVVQVKELQTELKAAKEDAKLVIKKADVASAKSAECKNDLAAIMKRIGALEKESHMK